MQRGDRRRLRAGTEFGIAHQNGSFAPVSRPVSEEQRIKMEGHRPDDLIAPIPRHLIPLPTPKRITAQIRARLNHLYTADRLETRYGGGRMELADFNPPERQDGTVWPTDGRVRADGAGHGADGHRPGPDGAGRADGAARADREGPDEDIGLRR